MAGGRGKIMGCNEDAASRITNKEHVETSDGGWSVTARVWEAVRLIVVAVNERSSTCVEDEPHCPFSTQVVFTSPDILRRRGLREHTRC